MHWSKSKHIAEIFEQIHIQILSLWNNDAGYYSSIPNVKFSQKAIRRDLSYLDIYKSIGPNEICSLVHLELIDASAFFRHLFIKKFADNFLMKKTILVMLPRSYAHAFSYYLLGKKNVKTKKSFKI